MYLVDVEDEDGRLLLWVWHRGEQRELDLDDYDIRPDAMLRMTVVVDASGELADRRCCELAGDSLLALWELDGPGPGSPVSFTRAGTVTTFAVE